VLAGTVDSWVLWNLTGRQVHATDHSNASRTMLLNLATGQWDDTLLELFGIPPHMMPAIQPSVGVFGHTDPSILGCEIPIAAIFGDQQAALYGHGCDRPGLLKCTYGTGRFWYRIPEMTSCDRTTSCSPPWPGQKPQKLLNSPILAMRSRAACSPLGPAFSGCAMVCK
jgi:glycerol kinase